MATTARTIAGYAISAVAMLVLTHNLTPGEFGVYSVLVGASTIAFNATTIGFVYAFTRSSKEIDQDVIDAAFWLFELIYIATAILLVGISFLVQAESAHIILRGMAGFLLVAPFRFPMTVRCWRKLEMGRLALVDFSELAVLQIGSLVLVLGGAGAQSFGYAIVAGALVSASLSMMLVRWRPRRPHFEALRPWMAEVKPLMVSGILLLVRDNGSAPLLSVVFGTTVAGYYGWAAGITVTVLALASVSAQTLFLGLSRATSAQLRADALRRALPMLILAFGAAVAVAGASARPMAIVIFTDKWLPAVNGLRLLLAALGWASLLSLFITLAWIDLRVAAANKYLIAVGCLALALGLPAARLWGIAGYTGVLLLAMASVAAWAWAQASQIYRIGIEPVQFCLGIVFSACLTIGLGSATFGAGQASWRGLVEAVALSSLAFSASALVFTRGRAWHVMRDALSLLRV